MKQWIGALCAAAAAGLVLPAAADEALPLEAVVKGQALRGAAASAYSGSGFDHELIGERQVAQPQELFRWVPGMNVRSLGLGAVADSIALRGFSGGGRGGDIGMVIDGVPLNEAMSHADGYADLNVVIPLEIDSLTVLRGPVSPLFGNFNRGERVVIDTRRAGTCRQGDFSPGSRATGDAQAALGLQPAGGQQLNLPRRSTPPTAFARSRKPSVRRWPGAGRSTWRRRCNWRWPRGCTAARATRPRISRRRSSSATPMASTRACATTARARTSEPCAPTSMPCWRRG